jgi:hypothetical protein
VRRTYRFDRAGANGDGTHAAPAAETVA